MMGRAISFLVGLAETLLPLALALFGALFLLLGVLVLVYHLIGGLR